MFSNPGSRANPGSDGQLRIKNSLTVRTAPSAVNVFINTSTFGVGNAVSNILGNSVQVRITNPGTNIVITSGTLFLGNAVANVLANSIQAAVVNSTTNVVITPLTISLGNSVANVFVNSIFWGVTNSTANTKANPGTLTLAGAGSNTGLTLGTSTIAANGFTWLPNGILMQWFHCNVTTTPASFTFPTAFPTTCFVVVAGCNGSVTGLSVGIVNSNTTATGIVGANATAMNTVVTAIGH